MTYVVKALDEGQPVRATRVYSSSAAVLAMNFRAKGYTAVTILDTEGRPFDLEAFRRRYLPPLNGRRLGPPT